MRKELKDFANKQEAILKKNDYKYGWRTMHPKTCWRRAFEEMLELYDAIYHGKGDVVSETCDVANFMMFIANNYITKKEI